MTPRQRQQSGESGRQQQPTSSVSLTGVERLARRLVERWPEFTPRERRHFEALLRVHQKDLHGTPSGYAEHINRWERPCAPCRQAASDARRQWVHRRRRQQGGA